MKPYRYLRAGTSLAVLLAFSFSGTLSQRVKEQDRLLGKALVNVNLRNTTVNDALAQALRGAGMPGGIVMTRDCEQIRTHSLTPLKPSLRALLDAIVSAEPGYTWELNQGVVNLLPRDGGSPFLKTVIPRLEIRDAANLDDALEELLSAPEVQSQAGRYLGSRLIQGRVYGFSLQGQRVNAGMKLSLSAKNITVREALNKLASAHGTAVWLFIQSKCDGRRIYSIDFVSK